jgi:DNA-binding NarL/FixJ family response regulator
MTLTVVIAEDEEPSREQLRELAAAFPDLNVVGEAGDGEAALRAERRAVTTMNSVKRDG